jgi:hypothetical protein
MEGVGTLGDAALPLLNRGTIRAVTEAGNPFLVTASTFANEGAVAAGAGSLRSRSGR